ncbi:MAG: type VI secretion system baseplate subunit TssG [Planctomycetota bacterium]
MSSALDDDAGSYEFFQAVRLLEAAAARAGAARGIGGDNHPDAECLRLRTRPSLGFAPSEIVELRDDGRARAEMDVAFLGFVGTAGTLPQRYTELAIERIQLRDPTLRDWFDLFQHRVLSLFYRAWNKNRFAFAYERERREHGAEDAFTRAVFALIGLGEKRLRGRSRLPDERAAYCGGHLSRDVRSAQGLARALQDLTGVPARVEEFVGRWLRIPTEERCVLPFRGERGDHRVALGGGATLGERCFDVQSRIGILLGPMSLSDYERLSGCGAEPHPWVDLARFYLRAEHDFAVRFELAPGQSPGTRLAARGSPGRSRLGSNTWLEREPGSSAPRFAVAPGGISRNTSP